MRPGIKILAHAFIVGGLMAPPFLAHAAATFTQLYAFTGGADGAAPSTSVTFDAQGNLYGETAAGANICPDGQLEGGGNNGCGTLFKLSPSGQLTTLVTFTGPNGTNGEGQPTLIGDTLYASTYLGGASDLGVIFSVKTDGTGFQLIHQFSGKDGANPLGPLIPSGDGGLYGIAYHGGHYRSKTGEGNGVLFKINPNGSYIPLHDFRGIGQKDGGQPEALIIDAAGTLWGSTLNGGQGGCKYGCGTIFSYVPSTNTFSTVYMLSNSHRGPAGPYLGSIDAAGNLYGAAESGGKHAGGTLFELAPVNGAYTLITLHDFGSGNGKDGYGPLSGPTLLPNNTLIGTTEGSIYFYDTGLKYNGRVIQSYSRNNLSQPMIGPDGAAYGAAALDGLTTNCVLENGTIFLPGPGCGFIYSEARPGAPH